MINVKNLKKSYDNIEVLKDITFEIGESEILGIIGKSGAGKSTLLNCLIGLENYDFGSIMIDGKVMHQLNDEDKRLLGREMSLVFQNASLMASKNIFKNIAFPMEVWGYSKQEIEQRVFELAKLVGIEDKLKSRPAELSGGQRQRVSIARALALNPKYILCDESTSALDPKTTDSILNLLYSIWKETGITIIMVTHEMHVVQKICQRMILLSDGNIVEDGPVKDVFLNKSKHLTAFLGEIMTDFQIPDNEIFVRIISERNDYDSKLFCQLAGVSESNYSIHRFATYKFHDGNYLYAVLSVNKSELNKYIRFFEVNKVGYIIGGESDE